MIRVVTSDYFVGWRANTRPSYFSINAPPVFYKRAGVFFMPFDLHKHLSALLAHKGKEAL